MMARREIARKRVPREAQQRVERPSTGSGRPEPVEGRISFKCLEFHVSGFKLFDSDW